MGSTNERQIGRVVGYGVRWERARRIGIIKPPSGCTTLGIHFLSRHIGLQNSGRELQKKPRYSSKVTSKRRSKIVPGFIVCRSMRLPTSSRMQMRSTRTVSRCSRSMRSGMVFCARFPASFDAMDFLPRSFSATASAVWNAAGAAPCFRRKTRAGNRSGPAALER